MGDTVGVGVEGKGVERLAVTAGRAIAAVGPGVSEGVAVVVGSSVGVGPAKSGEEIDKTAQSNATARRHPLGRSNE